jgi:MerR family transcriptional regulator, light-induced transcriptional regulator
MGGPVVASVIGLVESAKAYLPGFGALKKRTLRKDVRSEPALVPRPEAVANVITDEVIPRLLAAHRHEGHDYVLDRPDHVTPEEASHFAPLALDLEADALLDHVDVFIRRGVSIDTVFVELLAPAARCLGELWDDDLCDFVDVTMGLWRLQEIVRELSGRVPEGYSDPSGQPRALFSAMPGDQHGFGIVMVEDVFRRGGWATDCLTECTTPDLLDRVARSSIDLVGLTVTQDDHIPRLAPLILALRSVSRNPRLCIMIGGRVPRENPKLVTLCGADGTAPDAVQALELAGRLVAALASREVISA